MSGRHCQTKFVIVVPLPEAFDSDSSPEAAAPDDRFGHSRRSGRAIAVATIGWLGRACSPAVLIGAASLEIGELRSVKQPASGRERRHREQVRLFTSCVVPAVGVGAWLVIGIVLVLVGVVWLPETTSSTVDPLIAGFVIGAVSGVLVDKAPRNLTDPGPRRSHEDASRRSTGRRRCAPCRRRCGGRSRRGRRSGVRDGACRRRNGDADRRGSSLGLLGRRRLAGASSLCQCVGDPTTDEQHHNDGQCDPAPAGAASRSQVGTAVGTVRCVSGHVGLAFRAASVSGRASRLCMRVRHRRTITARVVIMHLVSHHNLTPQGVKASVTAMAVEDRVGGSKCALVSRSSRGRARA